MLAVPPMKVGEALEAVALFKPVPGAGSGLIARRAVQVGGERGFLAARGGRLVQGPAAGPGGGEGQDREVQVGTTLVLETGDYSDVRR